MGSEEHAFVLVGKMRPAVVLIEDASQWAKSPTEKLALCIPLYRVSKAKFSQSFVLKTQAFRYPSKFYLPADSSYKLEEGIARFEVMQTVHQLVTAPFPNENRPLMLTDEFFALLRMHLTRFLGGLLTADEQEILDVYGQLTLEEARKQGVAV